VQLRRKCNGGKCPGASAALQRLPEGAAGRGVPDNAAASLLRQADGTSDGAPLPLYRRYASNRVASWGQESGRADFTDRRMNEMPKRRIIADASKVYLHGIANGHSTKLPPSDA
jgi:hypothetical protein